MKAKFSELEQITSIPVPLSKKPMRNNDHAVISYFNMRNQELNISVTETEFETIEFSKDYRYMQLPEFMQWTKGSKGPYLTKKNVETSASTTEIAW